jgi:hypothetical protein
MPYQPLVTHYCKKFHEAALVGDTPLVSDHRGSNSQPIDFQGVEIYPVLTAKIENTEKSST